MCLVIKMKIMLITLTILIILSAQTFADGIALNEDNSHYFGRWYGTTPTEEQVAAWVDQYANTGVKELMLCTNAQRVNFDSRVWDPLWHNYDPNGPDDQPLFASMTDPKQRTRARRWVDSVYNLNKAGIDVYAIWIGRCREKNISPWISMRMNDVHNADDRQNYIHSEFWREHPEYWRYPFRMHTLVDRELDYAQPEVRERSLKLIRELADRYDFDGLELDWMRFPYHFRPGHETEGQQILTQFMTDVRKILDKAEKRRGHEIKLGARVPTRPDVALGLGMDAVTWARNGLIDMLVVAPFWESTDTDIPLELWRQLLTGANVTLAAGIEIRILPYPKGPVGFNSIDTLRGMATSFLDRGADRIYLFNYMDANPTGGAVNSYHRILTELASMDLMEGKPKRFVQTYTDTWAPAQAKAIALPAEVGKDHWAAFRIHTGPKPESGTTKAILGIKNGAPINEGDIEVYINGEKCQLAGEITLPAPSPDFPTYAFDVPLATMQHGYNMLEFRANKDVTIGWAEFYSQP